MTFLSLLCALLIEQVRPLRADNAFYRVVEEFASKVESWFNAGEIHHGRVAWFAMMAALVLPTAIVYWICVAISPFIAFGWNILIIYLTLGFRHYSHYFTSIQMALHAGDEAAARRVLAEWTGQDATAMETGEIVRVAIEKALVTSHRHVFGVFFCLILPIGPAGAVLYRVSEYLARTWNEPTHLHSELFGQFAARAFYWIDWIPARLTAAAFAVVGNFEDAIYAWRNFAARWKNETVGIILTAGGGAMGVRLGTPAETAVRLTPDDDLLDGDAAAAEPDILPGIAPTVPALQSTVGLVWRALLLWMLLLLLLSLAALLG
jgi:adenosylcobinamide-phosphate synthase